MDSWEDQTSMSAQKWLKVRIHDVSKRRSFHAIIFKFYWYINYNYELNIFIDCHGLSDPLSSTPKCGPNYGSRCNALTRTQDLYCNTDTGKCGGTLDYKDAQTDDTYDWDPKSCRSKNPSKMSFLHRDLFCF